MLTLLQLKINLMEILTRLYPRYIGQCYDDGGGGDARILQMDNVSYHIVLDASFLHVKVLSLSYPWVPCHI